MKSGRYSLYFILSSSVSCSCGLLTTDEVFGAVISERDVDSLEERDKSSNLESFSFKSWISEVISLVVWLEKLITALLVILLADLVEALFLGLGSASALCCIHETLYEHSLENFKHAVHLGLFLSHLILRFLQ
ncbi:hypothetical protein WICPIJ_004249 [Wickerhamomyces pijperi]|uniref:Uncharacterized protein n=1 Tax=Wickerhamomyces pijperi TaxID=599730 RepID=A0A9P8TN38_WICPI|nr:hypothetical protein WICPIJ_004249 [Wickerhamomyces pijperi]